MKGVPSGPTLALAALSETSSPVWGRCGCGWHAPGTGPYLPPDHAVAQFRQASLADDWRYLVLEGVHWRGRRPGGRQWVPLLVASGVWADGSRPLRACTRSTGESPTAWEGL